MHTDTHTLASFAGNIIYNNYQEMTPDTCAATINTSCNNRIAQAP